MENRYLIYIWLLIISSVITFFLGLIVFLGKRKSKKSHYFVAAMITLTFWSLPNAFEIMAVTLKEKLFWCNVQYFAYCFSPFTLAALCMDFTGYDKLIRNKKLIWFAILPTITIILVWTNSYHGLIRYDVYLDQSGPFATIAKKYGIAFYIHAAYSYFLNISAVVLLFRALFKKKSIYLKQTIILLIGSCLIIVPNMIYVFGLSPFKVDITPVFFGPSGLITMYAIFRYKLFELIPLARNTVIETMNIGVMVTDLMDKVIDMNPAFMKIAKIPTSQFYDMGIDQACSNIPDFVAVYKRDLSNYEFTVRTDEKEAIFEVLFTPLRDKKGNQIGRIAIVYDVTDRELAQQEFLKQQRALAGLEEKERLARDLHDNLGQLLGFINMQAQGINKELSNAGIDLVADKIEKLVKITQTAHNEIRDYIRDARTPMNQMQCFISELKKIISLFEYQTGIQVELIADCSIKDDTIKPYIGIHLLNIIKEGLNNIRKHANAKNVKVVMRVSEGEICITVTDDGKGFDLEKEYGNNRGFGLSIIRERAYSIGGNVQIESGIGIGTKIIVSAPLEHQQV